MISLSDLKFQVASVWVRLKSALNTFRATRFHVTGIGELMAMAHFMPGSTVNWEGKKNPAGAGLESISTLQSLVGLHCHQYRLLHCCRLQRLHSPVLLGLEYLLHLGDLQVQLRRPR